MPLRYRHSEVPLRAPVYLCFFFLCHVHLCQLHDNRSAQCAASTLQEGIMNIAAAICMYTSTTNAWVPRVVRITWASMYVCTRRQRPAAARVRSHGHMAKTTHNRFISSGFRGRGSSNTLEGLGRSRYHLKQDQRAVSVVQKTS